MKLAFGIPWSSPFCWTEAFKPLVNMQRPEGCETRFFIGTGWCPARRHNHIVEQALQWGADLIVICGADQVHPEDMLCRLVNRWEQGYEVVAALVPARGYVAWQPMKPFQRMAWRFKPNPPGDYKIRHYRNMQLDYDMIEVIDPDAGEMQRVDFIGSGVLMFHRDHILALKKPWFAETVHYESQQRIANQDAVFVRRLKLEAHAQVWVDTTIKVRHLHAFQIDETFPERFADWAQDNVGDPEISRYGGQGGYLYKQVMDENSPHRRRFNIVLHWAGDLTGKRVLEIGSDDGTYLQAFAKHNAELALGIDPRTEPTLSLPPNAEFRKCALEDLTGEERFDLIHLGELLEHVDDPESVLSHISRHWPDAEIIVSVPNFWARDHKRTYTKDTFQHEIEPFIEAEEDATVSWQYHSPEGVFEWFMVKGKVKPLMSTQIRLNGGDNEHGNRALS